MTSPRKPTAGFWIAVALVAVLVAYPLSWGPANRLATRGLIPESLLSAMEIVYLPINWLAFYGPEPVSTLLLWYGGFWA